MTLTAILLVLFIGLVLILLEIFVIPGIGIAGILGIALFIAGIWFGYQIDEKTGHLILIFTVAVSGGLTFLAFRTKTWDRVALKDELTSKAVAEFGAQFEEGMVGKTITRLNPSGNAKFGDEIIEVFTRGEFVNENTDVVIVKKDSNKVIVKQLN